MAFNGPGIIPRPPFQSETQSLVNICRGMLAGMLWKSSYVNLFIAYFQRIVFTVVQIKNLNDEFKG